MSRRLISWLRGCRATGSMSSSVTALNDRRTGRRHRFPHSIRNHAMTTPHAVPLEPTRIHVSDEVLDDLRVRLALTRPPLDEGNEDWSYGVPDGYLRELVAYWRDGYDWRR